MEKRGRATQVTDGNTMLRMRCACWIHKATDTHSQYIILIAFPLQQWLQERASMLRYTYGAACLLSACENTNTSLKYIYSFDVVLTVHRR